MNRLKAERKIRRKIARTKLCPFCGKIPRITVRCDMEHSSYGSWGHYATRKKCCNATSMGQTELFFCNNFKKPNYGLWWNMLSCMVDDWNKRHGDS